MTMQQIEVYSEATNQAIVRIPTRRFPGVVIQGDTLSSLLSVANFICDATKDSPDEDLVVEVSGLRDLLEAFLLHYEAVLREHGISLPYVRQPRA